MKGQREKVQSKWKLGSWRGNYGEWRKANKILTTTEQREELVTIMSRTPSQVSPYLEQVASMPEEENRVLG